MGHIIHLLEWAHAVSKENPDEYTAGQLRVLEDFAALARRAAAEYGYRQTDMAAGDYGIHA
jgi:hypothetical protein